MTDDVDSLQNSAARKSDAKIDAARVQNLVVCMDELKANLLAQSCSCPGVSTLIYNLIASASMPEDEVDRRKDPWLAEYLSGVEYEIYRVPLSIHFEGLSFLQVRWYIIIPCELALSLTLLCMAGCGDCV